MNNKIISSFTLMMCAGTLIANCGLAQSNAGDNFFDPLSFGVVLDHAAMKDVIVKKDIVYLEDNKGSLRMDVYLPPKLKANERKPAIIFLNAIGDDSGQRKVKSWGIYTSWPKLMAAYGYVGISMEADGARIQESIKALFNFLDISGNKFGIDKNRLGVYAASANVRQSARYLMSDSAYKGIKAAVLYYGASPDGPFRKDLPVYFVISEGDVRPGSYATLWTEVLKNNAPWTIKMGTAMPHAFDAYSDNDDARKIVKETISFWKDQLDPVPQPLFAHSKLRDVFGLLRMNPSKGLELLKNVVDEHPDNMRLLSFYADVLRENGKSDEAEVVFKKVLAKDPKDTRTLISLAAISYAKDKTEEAEKYVSAAEQSGKLTSNNYGNLGFFLLVAGKDKEAAHYYEKAVALLPNGFDFYNLACAYAKYGEKDQAFTALAKSLELGYGSKQQIESDNDFTSLRTDDRYKQLLEKIK